MPTEKFKYLKQSITISGLDTPTFGSALDATVEIFGYFDRQFGEGKLQSWSPAGHTNNLHASNRYLTPRRDGSEDQSVAFGDLVDPKKILTSMQGDHYIHTEENQVLYYMRHTNTDGKMM